MKNYNETIESVLQRSSIILKEKEEKRRKMRTAIGLTVPGLFIGALLIAVALNVRSEQEEPGNLPDVDGKNTLVANTHEEQNNISKEQSVQAEKQNDQPADISRIDETSSIDNKEKEDPAQISNPGISADDPRIIWGERADFECGEGEWNGKTIGTDLSHRLYYDTDPDSIYAVKVQARILYDFYRYYNDENGKDEKDKFNDEFTYKGKNLAWYDAEFEKEQELPDRLYNLLLVGDALKLGEQSYAPGGVKGWTKEFYDSTVSSIGQELIDKYIVDGEFLREKLEYDMSQPQPYSARKEYFAAVEACEKETLDKVEESLKSENIQYERINVVYNQPIAKYNDSSSHNSEDEEYYYKLERNEQYIIIYTTKEQLAAFSPDYYPSNLVYNLARKCDKEGNPFEPSDL